MSTGHRQSRQAASKRRKSHARRKRLARLKRDLLLLPLVMGVCFVVCLVMGLGGRLLDRATDPRPGMSLFSATDGLSLSDKARLFKAYSEGGLDAAKEEARRMIEASGAGAADMEAQLRALSNEGDGWLMRALKGRKARQAARLDMPRTGQDASGGLSINEALNAMCDSDKDRLRKAYRSGGREAAKREGRRILEETRGVAISDEELDTALEGYEERSR